MSATLKERDSFILYNDKSEKGLACNQTSVSGAVSQRACVYCGARVVLNPVADAVHIVHGPIGCASYTWDIRGSLSSGSELYRNSYSTDLGERDIIFGGEDKLKAAIDEAVKTLNPSVIFVYATCVVGIIGDDIGGICRAAEKQYGIRVIPVSSSGFAGTKTSGYKAACDAIMELMGEPEPECERDPLTFNYMGDFNLAGELWILKNYFDEIGIDVIATITGDGRCDDLMRAKGAAHNIIQCAGSMHYLASRMEDRYSIPYTQVSFFGLDDTTESLEEIARLTGSDTVMERVQRLVARKKAEVEPILDRYRARLAGKTAAIYVGGGFKAISLIKQFNSLGIKTVMVGTQTGRPSEYETIKFLSDMGTVILDDANPSELKHFITEKGADILVGGVKERPLAFKLGVAFIDHNHERKHPLAGFEGAVNFAKEVDLTVNSPVWGMAREGF